MRSLIRWRVWLRRWRRRFPALQAVGFTVATLLGAIMLFALIAGSGGGLTAVVATPALVVALAGLLIFLGAALALTARRADLLADLLARTARDNEILTDRNWELREAEERARAFIEAQGDIILRRDTCGRVTFVNDAFCAFVGIPRNALIGTQFAPVVMQQGPTRHLSDGARLHDQQITGTHGARWIAWHESWVRVETAPEAELQCVGRDVTDRIEGEVATAHARDRADAANRAKSRFLAMVSHEIRTPLNGILGMTGLLADTRLTPEQATYVKAVKTSGEGLLALIEEILDFSKIEAGKIDLVEEPFALAALVEDVVELLAPRAQAKDLEIACYVDDALPSRLCGDAARLRQVLLNLAGNAIKFTVEGGVAIVAEPGAVPETIRFVVSDTGIGIAPEAQARIFGEFEQADSSTARRHGGSGLGLAISKRIVEQMGGEISLTSEEGQGSHFSFTLALSADAAAASEPALSAPDLSGQSVLLVAARGIEAALLARRLERWGAHASVVTSRAIAETVLPERQWLAVIIDLALGAETASALAQQAQRCSTHRLVTITPVNRSAADSLRDKGFTGYLITPVRPVSLAARLTAAADTFSADEPAPLSVPLPEGARAAGRGMSILAAEDNEINALFVRALLARLGHRPTIACSGEDALDAFTAAHDAGRPYDLVLMDVQMPGMDGIEATQRIREFEVARGVDRTPVLALTANTFQEDRDACLAAGMDDFLIKPLDRERLEAALARVTAAPTLAA